MKPAWGSQNSEEKMRSLRSIRSSIDPRLLIGPILRDSISLFFWEGHGLAFAVEFQLAGGVFGDARGDEVAGFVF